MTEQFQIGPEMVVPHMPPSETIGNVTYWRDLIQGSDEWLAARLGLLTASEMKHIITPTLKVANNETTRTHVYELLAQRITRYVEPQYVSDDMLRGKTDEMDALMLYAEHYAPLQNIGFMTNSKWGFTIGYSPDALVGMDGLVECKSRMQKYQIQTICENVWTDDAKTAPADYLMQLQTGLLVSERDWIDFISYSGGLPMAVCRIYPMPDVQAAILEAAGEFETRLEEKHRDYRGALDKHKLIPTERKIIQEMF